MRDHFAVLSVWPSNVGFALSIVHDCLVSSVLWLPPVGRTALFESQFAVVWAIASLMTWPVLRHLSIPFGLIRGWKRCESGACWRMKYAGGRFVAVFAIVSASKCFGHPFPFLFRVCYQRNQQKDECHALSIGNVQCVSDQQLACASILFISVSIKHKGNRKHRKFAYFRIEATASSFY